MPVNISDLFDTALHTAAIWHDGLSLDRYRAHVDKMINALQTESDAHPVDVMKDIFKNNSYAVAAKPDPLQNNNIIRVIERRTGSAVALALLVTHCLRGAEYSCNILDFPEHALCALTHNGERTIFEPAGGFEPLNAHALRALIKRDIGDHAELSSHYMAPLSDADILTRLNNPIKFTLIDQEAYNDALKIVDVMIDINPLEYRLLLEKAVLQSRTFHIDDAIATLHDYIAIAPHAHERTEARQLIADLQAL